MKRKIELILYEVLEKEIDEQSLLREMKRKGIDFEIISNFDSLSLVSILVNLEERIQDELDVTIVFASEKAMSKRGPFSTVKSLIKFATELIEEQNK